jgi:hypothetical protein
MMPDAALFRRWVGAAARAPSAHNTQPARWRLTHIEVELHEDPTRWLAAGDETARDQRVALGMAWEAMSLAASVDGWRIAPPNFDDVLWPAPASSVRRIAHAAVEHGAALDPLAAAQTRRHCWRGKFTAADARARSTLSDVMREHAVIVHVVPESAQAALAAIYDRAAAKLLEHHGTASELYAWMRFSSRDERWSRDGLSADCMALSGAEARVASWLMRPNVLVWLRRFGLLGLLVSERAKTLSATTLVVINSDAASSPFSVGRAWYRFWLGLTTAGLSAVPMSALVDEPQAREELARIASLPADRIPFNVMRVGMAPHENLPVSARLPLEELILATRVA